MKKKVLKCGYLILFALFTFISVQGTLHAAVISSLSDNFDSENGSVGLLNYNTFANWNVTGGAVDLIPVGNQWNYCSGNGLCVDLDGSTRNAGILSTKDTFAPGTYTLTFLIGGSQRGDTNIVDVTVGNLSQTLTIGSGDALALKSFTFSSLGGEDLTFHNRGETTKALS